jgi:dolichyl-diphosphooligosaccharide--protein glycosyltransferase
MEQIFMGAKETISKYKPFIIVIILFLLVFFIRAQSVNLSGVSDQLKPYYMDDAGVPYFSEMDSYYNYRLTSNYIEHGYLGDVKINGTNWDLHSNYPPGRSAEYPPLIVYLTAFLYQIANIIGKVPLLVVAYWVPAVIASLAVFPAYFLVRRISNDYGAVTAALLASLAPAYFAHTFAGFFDTDMFNVVLPLFTVLFLVMSIQATDFRKRGLYAVLASLSIFLFSTAWEGWVYIFYLIIGALIIYLIVSRFLMGMETVLPRSQFQNTKEWLLNQPLITPLLIFIIVSSLLMLISMGLGFFYALLGIFGYTSLQATTTATAYPNVYVSVAELQIPSIMEVVNNVGGLIPFIFGILGVFLLFWKLKPQKQKEPTPEESNQKKKSKKKPKKEEKKEKTLPDVTPTEKRNYLLYGVILVLWLLITAYALTKGVRFAAAFSIPIALGAGIFVGLIREYVNLHVDDHSYRVIIMVILVALAVYYPVTSAYATSYSVLPGTDDSMVSSLEWIKANTPNSTVIISWWDYGHLFATKADRANTFDGGSQNTPRAYWVGKALLTSDENLSAGILRMLGSSGDQGYLTLDNYTKNTAKSVEILNKVLGADKTAAQTVMTTEYGLTAEQAVNVLKYTHPDNATPVVFITSSDMVGKSGWWSYFGSWNFNNNSGSNYIYSSGIGKTTDVNNTTVIQGDNNVVAQINGSEILAGLWVSENKIAEPHRVISIVDGNVSYDKVKNNASMFSIILDKQNNTYITVAMNQELENSIFTRLYFLKGQGLTKFQLAHEEPGVLVWNVL